MALRGLFRVRERLFSRLDNVLFILMEAIVILDNLNLNLSKLVFCSNVRSDLASDKYD